MIAILLSLLLAAPVPCPQPHRSRGAVAKFRRLHPCPGGPDKGSKTRCKGYVVDHICPLACCGIDAVQNMQYQSIAAGKAKDRWELQCTRSCGRLNPP
jgi:hypothetical protein